MADAAGSLSSKVWDVYLIKLFYITSVKNRKKRKELEGVHSRSDPDSEASVSGSSKAKMGPVGNSFLPGILT